MLLAQLVQQWTDKPEIIGSNPTRGDFVAAEKFSLSLRKAFVKQSRTIKLE